MNSERRHELRSEAGIRFLRQQEGAPENQFIRQVTAALKGRIEVGYLAQVQYLATGAFGVALCLRSKTAEEEIVSAVGEVFGGLFGTSQRLDIIFLTDDQEVALKRVCKPFLETYDDLT
jgi:hypothetical protein